MAASKLVIALMRRTDMGAMLRDAMNQPAFGAPDEIDPAPTNAEVEEWAALERQRREMWLRGPTQEEKLVWAKRERRLVEADGLPPRGRGGSFSWSPMRYARDAQLAAEGAFRRKELDA